MAASEDFYTPETPGDGEVGADGLSLWLNGVAVNQEPGTTEYIKSAAAGR